MDNIKFKTSIVSTELCSHLLSLFAAIIYPEKKVFYFCLCVCVFVL